MDLDLLHKAVSEGLLERIKDPDCAPSDYANAIRFLKDNGITSMAEFDDSLATLVEGIDLNDGVFQPKLIGGSDVE